MVTVTASSSLAGSEADHDKALYLLSLSQPQRAQSKKLYCLAKRVFDVVSSALLLVLLAPLLLIVATLIKATSPGPAILVQERVGRGGRVFLFYKFRSMYNNPDRSADMRFAREYINANHPVIVAHGGVFKPANDKRITPPGRFLRKASLDELPQLFNVLKGDMSLVGPRPHIPYEVDMYRPQHFRRLEVLPGMTGPGQVSGRSRLTFQEVVSYDLDYIERRSLLLDLRILLRTVPVVLSGRGAR